MPIKSIWQQISNPREMYIDGYGTQREVYEPEYVTRGRDVYQTVHKWFNPGENLQLIDPETGESYKVNINSGAGILMDAIDPAGVIGKVDDVAMLAKHLDKFKMDELRRFKLRRKVNSTPGAKKSLERKFSKTAEGELAEEFLDLPHNAWYTEDDVLNRIGDKVQSRIQGNRLKQRELELDRQLNPLAKQYNELLKSGKTEDASKIKQKMWEIVQDYEAPWSSGSYYDVNTRIFDTKNGGSGLTPKEKQTLLLDVELPW